MSSPVRVLHIAKSLGLGGTEKVMQLFAQHLDAGRFAVAVHSPVDGPRAAQLRASGIQTFVGQSLERALEAFRPHIVHVHRAGWPEPELLRPLRDPDLLVVETNVFGRHDPSPSGQHIDCHLFVSHFCAERFTRLHGIAAEWPRFAVLYNPVDTDFFAQALPSGPAFNEPLLGRISRADPGKWSRLALDILPLLAVSVPGFRARIIGAIPEAVEFVHEHRLEACVEFLPPAVTDADLAQFYGGLSVLAHANDTGESFGLVIAEAMACGLPVVTHPAAGERDNAQLELVDHGVTGLVANTTEEYAQAVRWLFTNPDQAHRMGQAGRAKAHAFYRAQHVASQLGELYDKLLVFKAAQAGDG